MNKKTNEELRKIRSEFFADLNGLLAHYKRFLEDSEGNDPSCDNWDWVLDDCQNIFVKWIVEK